MLRQITDREVMTVRQAAKKYLTQHFIMIITTIIDTQDNDLGYVIYVADNEEELLRVPRSDYIGKRAAIMFGDAAEPYPSIGNVVYHAG